MSKLITRIKRLALALCLATPIVSWAAFERTNPVTGETEEYTWKFVGTDTWNGSQYWEDSTGANPAEGGVPAKTSGGEIWDPILFDNNDPGHTINIAASMSVEGWNLRLGLYNGANVRLNTFPKWQGDTDMWVTVDGTSKFTVGGFGGGNLADNKIIKCSTSRENGIEWLVNLESTGTANNTFEYYLAGSGSVSYQAVSAANHKIKMADVTLSGGEKSVQSKTLVSFTSSSKTFTADATIKVLANDVVVGSDLLVSVNTTGSTTLTTSDRVGACELVQTSTGIVLCYVDGPAYEEKTYTPSININFTNSGVGIDTTADIGLAGYAVPGNAWNNIAGAEGTTTDTIKKIDATGTATVDAGISVAVTTTRGSWECSELSGATDLRRGYIDESDGKATPTVTITGIPYDNYRVIVYHATDSANVPFGYDTINGNDFTYVNGVQTIGTSSWGNSGASNSAEAIAEGVNTLVSGILSGSTVTMVAHRIGTGTPSARGCFAAIQVVEVALNENDLIIPVNGETVYTVSEDKNLENVYITGIGTLTFDGEGAITAATMDIDTGAVVTIDETRLSATTITGSGTVIYDGSQPDASKGFDDAAWTGTVWVKNVGSNGTTAKVNTGLGTADTADASSNLLNSWGNASSFVKFTNVRGYTSAANCPWTLILEDDVSDPEDVKYAWYDNNGWTARSATFAGLKGSGTFYDANFTDCRQAINFTDASGFTGSIYAQGKRIGLGGATTVGDAAANAGSIEVVSGVTATLASGSTWTANAGITVNGTLNADGTLACLNGSSTSAVKGSGTVVFTGRAPTPTGDAWWPNASWTGTVEIKNNTTSLGNFNLTTYGNSGSKVCMNNANGYLLSTTNGGSHDIKELIIGEGGFTQNGGYSTLNSFDVPCKLTGSGTYTFSPTGAGQKTLFLSGDASEFTGLISVGGNNARVVVGESTEREFTASSITVGSGKVLTISKNMSDTPSGGLFIDDGGQVIIADSAFVWLSAGIVVDGTLKTSSRANRIGGGTAITLGDNGILEITGNNADESSVAYNGITGTGSIKYSGSGYLVLSTNYPTTIPLIDEKANALAVPATGATIGSLSGTKGFRSDWGNGGRYLTIKQAKDTAWSGSINQTGAHRLTGVVVDAGESTTGTLTLAGTQTQTASLAVNGSVNLTGTWVGATTVAGTIGGTGTLTGDLTFSAGSTFKASATPLTVSGTVAYPEEGTVTVDVTALGETPTVPVTILTGTGLDVSKFALAEGSPEGVTLAVEDGALKLDAASVEITITPVTGATASVTVNGSDTEIVDGKITVAIGAEVVVTYTSDGDYKITNGTVEFNATAETTAVDTSSVTSEVYKAQIMSGVAAGKYTTVAEALGVVAMTYASPAGVVVRVLDSEYEDDGTYDEYFIWDSTERTYTYRTFVARVGTKNYDSLVTAMDEVTAGGTVVCLVDTITLDAVLSVTKEVTLGGVNTGTTITGSALSNFIQLDEGGALTLVTTVTIGCQVKFMDAGATLTVPEEDYTEPSIRPLSGYTATSASNGDGTKTYSLLKTSYLYAAGVNVTLAYSPSGDAMNAIASVSEGDVINFTATPAAGYEKVVVTANSVALTPVDGVYTVTIGTENVTIQATASAMPTVTLPNMTGTHMTVTSVTVGGVEVAGVSGVYTVPSGSTVVVTFTADASVYFTGESTLTLNNVTGDMTVETSSLPEVAACPVRNVTQSTYSQTLAAAIEAAAAGDTLELVADDTGSFANVEVEARVPSNGSIVIDKNITIDGNGFTVYGNTNAEILNATGSSTPGYDMVADLVDGSNLLGFFVKSGNVTFTNITLTEFGDTAYVNKFGYTPIQTAFAYTGTLTLTNVNFSKFNRTAVCVRGGTLAMTGGTISGGTVNTNNGDYFQQPVEVRGGTATITGVTITGGDDIAGNGGGAIVAWGDATITDVNIDFTGYGIWSDGPAVTVTGEDTVVVADTALFAEEGGTIAVEAGDFTGTLAVDTDQNSGISITGGTFDSDVDGFCADGYIAVEDPAGTWTVQAGTWVAQIEGGATYQTLAEAIADATSGDTVTLLANVTLDSALQITKTLTLNLGGYTITGGNTTTSRIVVKDNGDVTLTGGGKIVSAAYDPSNTGCCLVRVDGNLTIGNVTIEAKPDFNGANAVAVFKQGHLIVNSGATIVANGFAISLNGIGSGENISKDAVATINGGTIQSVCDSAIYVPAGTVTINGGAITGKTGVYAKGGIITIPATTTATITANGEATEWEGSGSGADPTGDALVIDNSNYPYGPATISVAGGTWTSANAAAVGNYSMNEATLPLATSVISGGTFSSDVSALCVAGYAAVEGSAGTWTVQVQTVDPTATEGDPAGIVVPATATDEEVAEAVEEMPVTPTTAVAADWEDKGVEVEPETYTSYFTKTVARTGETTANVTIELNDAVVMPASIETQMATALDAVLDETTNPAAEGEVTLPAAATKPGLYYSIEVCEDLSFSGATVGDSTLATGAAIAVERPALSTTSGIWFYRVKVSATP